MKYASRSIALALLLAPTGCGSRSDIDRSSISSASVACPWPAPTCIADGTACDPATVVDPVCDPRGHEWRCPAGGRVYARASTPSSRCLPFVHASGLARVNGWGLGGISQVPTDDGRCLWIAESATLADGTAARNLAFEVDRTAPFGTCPEESISPPTPIVVIEGGDDGTSLVQIDGGYRIAGSTFVIYRLFKKDPTAALGVTHLGGGVARWDATQGRIVVPSTNKPLAWGTDLSLGDSMTSAGDGTHAYVWGCGVSGPFLLQGCVLARLDASANVELFTRSGTFVPSVRASDGAVVFDSGTWTSSVAVAPGGFQHVYIGDYGNALQSQQAASPLGPWSDGPGRGACDLPAGDAQAFCGGPIVHTDLVDPTRPDELPITYGVGTNGPQVGRPEGYWPRLVWTQ